MIDDELTALRHEVQCLRAQVKQSEYPCSPHCAGYLRELAIRSSLAWCIGQAETIMQISAKEQTTRTDARRDLDMISSLASDIAINLRLSAKGEK